MYAARKCLLVKAGIYISVKDSMSILILSQKWRYVRVMCSSVQSTGD